ncbi:hypothetical protein XI06_24970 [Bradyrhizobium sp. CCBAU 11434]|nr:hypothetical protein [Bradyrhizobium sp. CCBAU 11434]
MTLAPRREQDMLDTTTAEFSKSQTEQRHVGDFAIPFIFFTLAGTAMIAWVATLGWLSWRILAWLLF